MPYPNDPRRPEGPPMPRPGDFPPQRPDYPPLRPGFPPRDDY